MANYTGVVTQYIYSVFNRAAAQLNLTHSNSVCQALLNPMHLNTQQEMNVGYG